MLKSTTLIYSLTDLDDFSRSFSKLISPGDSVCLEGTLGVGKTTFVRLLVKALGFSDWVTSPTYTLVNQYSNGSERTDFQIINHLDLYRLPSDNALDLLDLSNYLNQPSNLALIEWADRLGDFSLKSVHRLVFSFDEINSERRRIDWFSPE